MVFKELGNSQLSELLDSLLLAMSLVGGVLGVSRNSPVEAQGRDEPNEVSCRKIAASLLAGLPSAALLLDQDFRVVCWNPMCDVVLGLSQRIRGRDFREVVLEPSFQQTIEDGAELAHKIRTGYLNAGVEPRLEVHVLESPDRAERWLEYSSSVIETGPCAGWRLEIFDDISVQHRTKSALGTIYSELSARTGNEFFRSVVRHLASTLKMDFAVIAGFNRRRPGTAITQAFFAKGRIRPNFEYPLSGTPCSQLFDGQQSCFPRGVRRLFPEDENLQRLKIESYVGTPLFDSTGQAFGVIAAFHSAPLPEPRIAEAMIKAFAARTAAELERKRAEEALARSEQKYRELADSLPQTVFETDRNGRLTFINKNGSKLLGFTHRDLKRGVQVTRAFVRADRARLMHIIGRIKEGLDSNSSCTVQRLDGETFPATIHAVPVMHEGSVAGMRAILVDITHRKDLEAQLLQSQKMEAIGSLAGGVAHDFNNLLMGISGYTHLALANAEANPDIRSDLEQIIQLADRAAGLTRQLLVFSRQQKLDPVPLNLNQLIHRSLNLLKPLIGEDVRVEFDSDPSLGRVRGDPGQLQQVIFNLAVNSRDAMPDGGAIRIETSNCHVEGFQREDDGEAGKTQAAVRLSISDTGSGMDRATQQRIFEPFFTTKSVGRGTGLGLSAVYGIVEQHRGNVRVESSPGEGTRFDILLPGEPSEAIEPAGASPGQDPLLGSEQGNETILVVEDEISVRKLLKRLLERQGYSVLTASEPLEAWEAFSCWGSKIALLVTDVVMPGGTGQQLYRGLAVKHPKLKVIYISGYPSRHSGDEADLGSNVLQKPIQPRDLVRSVRMELDRE